MNVRRSRGKTSSSLHQENWLILKMALRGRRRQNFEVELERERESELKKYSLFEIQVAVPPPTPRQTDRHIHTDK